MRHSKIISQIITNDEYPPVERLRIAILYFALQDYQDAYKAMRREKRNGEKWNSACCEMLSIERFFLSDWGAIVSNNMGEKLLELAKKRCKKLI